jgi:serine protease Do
MGRCKLVLVFCFALTWSTLAPAQNAARVCGSIGVQVRPMTATFADSLGMTTPYGALFRRPQPGGPAAQAGIEPYDVVTAINGVPLRSWRDFTGVISPIAPGTRIFLTTWRSKQLIQVPVVVAASKCSAAARGRS